LASVANWLTQTRKIPTSKHERLHAKLNLRVRPTLRVRRENTVAKFNNLTEVSQCPVNTFSRRTACVKEKTQQRTLAMSSQEEDNMMLSKLPETVDPMIVRLISLQFAKFLGQGLIVYFE